MNGSSWTLAVTSIRLGDFARQVRRVVSIQDDLDYRTLGCHLYGKGVYQRDTKSGSAIRCKRMFLVSEGDLVINRIWAQKGAAGIVSKELAGSVVTNDFPVVEIDQQMALPEYIAWYLRTPEFWNECARHSYGTSGRRRLAPSQVLDITIPLCDLDAQAETVEKLQAISAKKSAIEQEIVRIPKLTERLRTAILSKAFRGGFTMTLPRLEGLEGISPNALHISHNKILKLRAESGKKVHDKLPSIEPQKLPKIPDRWTWARFEEVVFVIDYRGRTPPFAREGVPHLRSSNIRDGRISWDGMKYVSDETFEEYMVRGLPRESDILFTTEAPLGEVALVPKMKFSLAQRVVVLRPNDALLDARFLYYQLMFGQFRDQLISRSTGTAVGGISYRNLRLAELALPPLEEQRMIVAIIEPRLAKVEKIAPPAESAYRMLDVLQRSILGRAFGGGLLSDT